MLFDEPAEVKEGQTIKGNFFKLNSSWNSGTIRYQRNPDLLRHLIFDLSFNVEEISTWFQFEMLVEKLHPWEVIDGTFKDLS